LENPDFSSFLSLPLQPKGYSPTSTFSYLIKSFFMHEQNMPGTRMPQGSASRFTRFLWWLSTAEPELLEDCVIDRNRYAIIGCTVLATWAFATLAWGYFFSTVTENGWVAVLLGLFMGAIILTIDRALIKGIRSSGRGKWIALIFRALLASMIGLFMAQPALLYLFAKDIRVQVSLDNEQRKKDKLQKQDSVYFQERSRLEKEKNILQQTLTARYAQVSAARDAFISETDGTGGSKKIGLKDIAAAKQREYQKLDGDYRQLELELSPKIHAADSSLAVLQVSINKEQAAFESLLSDGFITRIEALNHLVQNNGSVAFRYYLLVLILLLIELMPVISKTLLPEGSYERKTQLKEELEKQLIENNHRRELALKELYNAEAFENDADFIKAFFKKSAGEKTVKMEESIAKWRDAGSSSFSGLWNELKAAALSKQEQ